MHVSDVRSDVHVFVSDAWEENDGIEYYFSANTMTQAEAQTCCQYAGGNLVSITSDEQNAYIQGVLVYFCIDDIRFNILFNLNYELLLNNRRRRKCY